MGMSVQQSAHACRRRSSSTSGGSTGHNARPGGPWQAPKRWSAEAPSQGCTTHPHPPTEAGGTHPGLHSAGSGGHPVAAGGGKTKGAWTAVDDSCREGGGGGGGGGAEGQLSR